MSIKSQVRRDYSGLRKCSFLKWILLPLCACVLSGCSSDESSSVLTYNMAWLPQGSQAGFVVADDRGFYSDAGIEVEIVRGFGGIRTVNEVARGIFDFGYGDPVAVALNRLNGGQTRLIGSINSQHPGGLCFVADRHEIESPEDLQGLTIGGGQSSPMQAFVPAWLELNGISRDSITLLQMDPAVVDAALIEGSIDVCECWRGSNRAFLEHRALEAGVSIRAIDYRDFGIDMYGSGIVASEQILAERPDVVRDFLVATYRGYAWALAHPEDAAEIMKRHYPILNDEITLQQIVETNELTGGEESLGILNPERMRTSMAFLERAFDLGGNVNTLDIYTPDFLPPTEQYIPPQEKE